ncbi:hypothetical protein QA601_18405 [Chitinispirillales bacterium ANBcel5]|uniref:hypothetical protein n=1 Tax=Cellulosispirillum alkaliphilum TaxID=3039283 RepID=UPI002A578E03|nr:hypothetical protein [Chitinispirillales bacterium ANBcel5]
MREWDDLKESSGLERLKEVHDRALEISAGVVGDPVSVENRGSLSEYGLPVKKRSNYAYYEGYSRLEVLFEKPEYSEGITGVGLLFTISDNIAIYSANSANIFDMFGEPLIFASDEHRRVIINITDPVIDTFDLDGLWVYGIPSDRQEHTWYCNIKPVRLVPQVLGRAPINSPFVAGGENRSDIHPRGEILGGTNKSVLKMYGLNNRGEVTDTLRNISSPEIMTHGERRRIEYNQDYFTGTDMVFRLQTAEEDQGKIFFTDSSKFGLTLVDTSPFSEPWTLLAMTYTKTSAEQGGGQAGVLDNDEGVLTEVKPVSAGVGKICFRDVTDRNLTVWATEPIVAVALEQNEDNHIDLRRNDQIKIEIIGKHFRMSRDRTFEIVEKDVLDITMSQADFRENVLGRTESSIPGIPDSLYLKFNEPGEYVLRISVIPSRARNRDNPPFEELTIIYPHLSITASGKDITEDEYSPKRDGEARIELIIESNENPNINNIHIEIKRNESDNNHTSFYPNSVVKTIEREIDNNSSELKFNWDGRDDFTERILLAGMYSVEMTASTLDGSNFTLSKNINVGKPVFGQLLVDLSDDESEAYMQYLESLHHENKINWDLIPYLDVKRDTRNFRWFYWPVQVLRSQLLLLQGDYDHRDVISGISAQNYVNEIENEFASVTTLAHHGVQNVLETPDVGFTRLAGDRLMAHCIGDANQYCINNLHCLNITCDNKTRDEKFLEDVLFAVAMGCRTAVGENSTADALINHGVNCVIATKRRVPVILGNFFLANLYERLSQGRTIEVAAEEAYRLALRHISAFYNNEDAEDLQDRFGNCHIDGQPFLNTYQNTIIILNNPNVNENVSGTSVLPARHGARVQ